MKQILQQPELIVSSDEIYQNEMGCYRLCKVRDQFGLQTSIKIYTGKNGEVKEKRTLKQTKPLTESDLEEITELYVKMRDQEEVVPIKYVWKDEQVYDLKDLPNIIDFKEKFGVRPEWQYKDYVCFTSERPEMVLYAACKRGNKKYIQIVKEKFKPFLEQEPKHFFSTDIESNRKRPRTTNMLYLTGTVAHKMSIATAYLQFGQYWNKFLTNVRNQFGKCVFIRTWQSQKNGYPHFHALVYFVSKAFSVVHNWDYNERTGKNDKLSWRIASRQKLHKGDKLTIRQRFKQAWKYGHLDIECVSDTHTCFKDLLKYVTRDLEGGESDLTNGMLWYFGKQSFGISPDFVEVVWGKKQCIDLAEPSNADLIKENLTNSNSELIRIEVFPSMLAEKVYQNVENPFQIDLLGEKKPPPKRQVLPHEVEFIVRDYVMVECKSTKFDGVPVFIWRRGQ